MVTTLSNLITALHESIEPGEEDLVTVAVVHLVNAGYVKCLDRPLCDAGSTPPCMAIKELQTLLAQFIAVCRRSKVVSMSPGRHHRDVCLYRR